MSSDWNAEEFTQLVKEHKSWMFQHAFHVCRELHPAEDLVQESLIKIWRRWPSLSSGGDLRFRGYFKETLKNCHLDYRKSKPSRHNIYEETLGPEVARTLRADGTAEEWLLAMEFRQNMWTAVATLKPVQQEILVRKYIEQHSIATAARQLGLAERTANRYHTQALRQLRELLEEGGHE